MATNCECAHWGMPRNVTVAGECDARDLPKWAFVQINDPEGGPLDVYHGCYLEAIRHDPTLPDVTGRKSKSARKKAEKARQQYLAGKRSW